MNKIILIGNGFDLAHGLETRYNDFINDFWEKEKIKFLNHSIHGFVHDSYIFQDEFIEMYCNSSKELRLLFLETKGYDWFKKVTSYFSNIRKSMTPSINALARVDAEERMHRELVLGELQYSLPKNNNTKRKFPKLIHKNTFLRLISEKSLTNWVDVEVEYYHALNLCHDRKWEGGIERLNSDFSIIKKALENYLIQQTKSEKDALPEIRDKITAIVSKSSATLFLSFNYTNTETLYCPDDTKCSVIHIHGELENPCNPIIFGYGDDTNDSYRRIASNYDDNYLENIKSFRYKETRNHAMMLDFINAGKYDVSIMGHSCGISDKSILKALFEHENCSLIKIFYYKWEDGDDYINRVFNISRIEQSLSNKVAVKMESESLV